MPAEKESGRKKSLTGCRSFLSLPKKPPTILPQKKTCPTPFLPNSICIGSPLPRPSILKSPACNAQNLCMFFAKALHVILISL